MLFNSYEFLIFFPAVVSLYFLLAPRHRSLLLLVASYGFYMHWRVEYAALLITSTVVDYGVAIAMSRTTAQSRRRLLLLLSLSVNLGLLFAFKYYGFFRVAADGFSRLLSSSLSLSFSPELPIFDVLLPVGISFYTFQTIGYTIDVYRGWVEPEKSFVQFALYVSFFPQLVAGPIERPGNLLPQLRATHTFDAERVSNGLKQIAWGLFKKVVVADRLALAVDTVYGAPGYYDGPQLVLATVLFAFQIYYDFSGYSDIAIGAARVLGIDLMNNFDRPFFSRSVAEFWRRWHISLSTWFRDYVYTSLGSNRVMRHRGYVNLMIVFILSGLWHGANWNFLAWGALHGFYLVFGAATERVRGTLADHIGLARVPRLRNAMRIGIVFGLVVFSFVFFRAAGIRQAVAIVKRLDLGWGRLVAGGTEAVAGSLEAMSLDFGSVALMGGLILFVELVSYLERAHFGRDLMSGRPTFVRWSFYLAITLGILNLGIARRVPFIYFQF